MLLCLSSGHNQLYRQDVLRALCLPAGTVLQFRYALVRIGGSVKSRIQRGDAVGQRTIITYIDQSEPAAPIQLIPCRLAEVASVTVLGTTVSIALKLREFVVAGDLRAFNVEAESTSSGTIPKRDAQQKITGCYCVELNAEPTTVVVSGDLSAFEQIVGQLATRSDFSREQAFCSIAGVFGRKSGLPLQPVEDGFSFKSGSEYFIRIYQFHPTSGAERHAVLRVATTSTLVHFAYYPEFQLVSRYDHIGVPFRTDRSLDTQIGLLRVELADEAQTFFVNIPIVIRGSFTKAVIYSLALTALLSAPHILTATSNDKLSSTSKLAIISVALITSFIAAVLAVFGVRRLL